MKNTDGADPQRVGPKQKMILPEGSDPIRIILLRVWGSHDIELFYPRMIRAARAPWEVSQLTMEELKETRELLTHLHHDVCKTSSQVEVGQKNLLASRPKNRNNVDVYLTHGAKEYKRLMVYDLLTKCGAYSDLIEILRRAKMVRNHGLTPNP